MRAGSLCTGIGGLDLAVEAHFGTELAWYSEVDAPPCIVLEREDPDVPNLGDLTALDWSQVPSIDVLSAGYPCQPFSTAGKRKGKDDERHLWPYVAEAVRVLRPRWVVLENVAGHLTMGFGDVLRDLAEAGFDAEWCVLRASDVGAPHQRARLFVAAWDANRPREDAHTAARSSRDRTGEPGRTSAHTDCLPAGRYSGTAPRSQGTHGRRGEPDVGDGPSDGAQLAPDATDLGHERSGPSRRGGHGPANSGHDAPNPDRQRLTGRQESDGRAEAGWFPEGPARDDADRLGVAPIEWGQYAPAILRWERLLGRCAPQPTDDRGRLNAPFVEWMMGYPLGWVDGLTRTQALKALGNAVVPQQGLAALRELVPPEQEAVA